MLVFWFPAAQYNVISGIFHPFEEHTILGIGFVIFSTNVTNLGGSSIVLCAPYFGTMQDV